MPASNSPIPSSLLEHFRKLVELQKKAEALGIFTDTRDLLACPNCGLQEDVLVDGRLITFQGPSPDGVDSGLRFTEQDGLFICPRCDERIQVEHDE